MIQQNEDNRFRKEGNHRRETKEIPSLEVKGGPLVTAMRRGQIRANWKAPEEISTVGGIDILDYVERSLYKLRKF